MRSYKGNRAQTGKGLPSGPWGFTDGVSGPGWQGGATRALRSCRVLLFRTRYLRAAPLRLAGLVVGTSGRPPANGPARGPGPSPLRGGRRAPDGGVPIPTVAASSDVGEVPNMPVAKMNEPT